MRFSRVGAGKRPNVEQLEWVPDVGDGSSNKFTLEQPTSNNEMASVFDKPQSYNRAFDFDISEGFRNEVSKKAKMEMVMNETKQALAHINAEGMRAEEAVMAKVSFVFMCTVMLAH